MTKVRQPVNHKTYHMQCGMTQLCYLGVLSRFVLYLVFYLVLSFIVRICYCLLQFLCADFQKGVLFSQ